MLFIKIGISLFICFIISIIDAKRFVIPDGLVFALFIFFLILDIVQIPHNILSNTMQALLMLVLFTLIHFFSRGFGFGDVKLIAVLAYGYGFFSTIYICLFASLTALFYVFILSKNKTYNDFSQIKNLKIPFAPFLTMGVFFIGIIEGAVV